MRSLPLILALFTTPALAEVPVVVTDIAPVHSLVAQVMGDLGAPDLLLDADADPHHFQMRPSQARALSDADALIWMGPALTPWLSRSLGTMSPEARSLPLLEAPGAPLRIDGAGAHDHDHDDHGHEEHEEEGTGDLDPHAWLDPLTAAYYLSVTAIELAALDPENAATYAANASAAAARLEALNTSLAPRLEPLKQATFIATHDGLSYLMARYDLSLAGTLSDSAGNTAGAAGMGALQDLLTSAPQPICILRDPGTSAKAIVNLAPDTTMKIVDLDPMGRDHPPGAEHYAAMMRSLADALASCANPSN